MLQKLYKTIGIGFLVVLIGITVGLSQKAFAATTPTTTANYTGTGDNVTLSVTGNPNTSAYIDYEMPGATAYTESPNPIGTTDQNGNLSTTISSASYGIPAGSSYYINVGGVHSATASWPYTSTTSSSSISFSPTSSNINYGQTVPITLSGGTGSYTITNNSNPSAVTATINGSTLSLYGANTTGGSANITVCSTTNTGNCSTFVASAAAANTNTNLSLGQSSITLTPGQTYNIPITGNGAYTLSSNSNSAIASANISGNLLTGTAIANGTTTVSVCQQSGTMCVPLTISVGSTTTPPQTTASPIQVTENLMIGQTVGLTLSGGTTPYVITNPASTVASSFLSNNTLTLSGLIQGQTSVTICSAGNTGCSTIGINVSGLADSGSGSTTSSGSGLTLLLQVGSRNSDVTILQEKLHALGMYSGAIDGDFGPMTQAAVEQYQTSKGLTSDGIVGPQTRAALNG